MVIEGFYLPSFYSEDIAIDADGYVYVAGKFTINATNNDCIKKYNSTGSLIKTSWYPGHSTDNATQGYTAITVDANGIIYVVDGQSGNILKFDPDGILLDEWVSSDRQF